MTVSYTGDVANGSSFGCFWKILYRWRGSVYKLIWRELIAYLFLYYIINIIYRFGLNEEDKTTFEKVKVYCRKNIESIPMSFVLGFYVTLIVKRWWDQYWILPMPDSLALYISASIQGQDERGRLLRRTIMRYTMLSYIICLQRISFRVKKRFPTMQHLVESGLMTESEMKIYEKMDSKAKVLKFWMPVVWASNLINRARSEGRIQSDHMVQTIVTELSDFRRKLGRIMVFDNVSVPLVYTQVVTLAVYTYFLAALIGRQWVAPKDRDLLTIVYPGYNLDLYFPIFLSLQFIFYIGWLKVAETLINPFGEDDDDFELNWLIDRHIKVSYMVVDEMHEEHPELLKDQYWEQVVPQDLPYNIASERYRKNEPQGSTASLKINPNESVYADLSSVKRHSAIPDDVYAEYESVAESPLADGRKNWLQRQLSRVESFRSTSSSSSLFGRNRANSAVNGGIGIGYHGHHRPSLYERLMNRRSSKDARRSSRGINRGTANSLSVPEKGFLPNSRPRVPTPDVTKDNQIPPQLQITAASPPPSGKYIMKSNYSNGDGLSSTTVNPGYGSPPSGQHTPLYAKKNQNNIIHLKSSVPSQQQQPLPAAPVTNVQSATTANNVAVTLKQNGSVPTPPPPYDQAHAASPTNAMILSTIAENDTSPYSTNSTAHTLNSSTVYPTTTSIFGRKPSPPPLEELPPIPTVTVSSTHTSNSGSLKSDHGGGSMMGSILSDPSINMDPGGRDHSSIEMLGRVNEGYETDDDDGRRYMTIAEVNECRVELEKKLAETSLQQTPLPPTPIVQKESQRNPSDDLVPIPTLVSIQPAVDITHPPLRHSPASIFRQDAVCLSDSNPDLQLVSPTTTNVQPVMTPLPVASVSSTEVPEIMSKPTKMETEEDDGYHERASYSEDDEGSNDSDKDGGGGRRSAEGNDESGGHGSSASNHSPPPPTFFHLDGRKPGHDVSVSSLQFRSMPSSNLSSGEVESETAPHHHSIDTIRSNASDSDNISHRSSSSVDHTFPIPTRQKPIRRRKTQTEITVGEGESSNASSYDDTSQKNNDDNKTSTPPPPEKVAKDQEVFV